MNCTIHLEKTKAMISFSYCTADLRLVFAKAKIRFSHDKAHLFHFQLSIKTSVDRHGFSAFVHMLFGPPKLNRSLLQERDIIFCTAACKLQSELPCRKSIQHGL